ncbi:orotidine-5'-phosphate decarboxylase [Vibrio ouci]|uniref:Orotidine-5'-phosphate decarboxylase n=1 Tax=Vibrio ouci TaxID=2499078 RepID=A0A4Y8WLK3_9VIBR|nr:orotidine-5'-phosphate decarboxylase [Vibrio ouci]TFH93148.1 orotidine-5'-phosphate decarboxylase [Vibrio ouci]
MKFNEKLSNRIQQQQSFLCIGLDPDKAILSDYGFRDDIFTYNKAIIDATHHYAAAYKPQFAHYAAIGQEEQLQQTIAYIKSEYPTIPVILDSKRGDIGSTASNYAIESYERYDVDAVTLNPYMGLETLAPYYDYQDRGCVVLVKTSNPGSKDFQDLLLASGEKLYQSIANAVLAKFDEAQSLFVVGATCLEELAQLRQAHPNTTFLVPGFGAQGGDLEGVILSGMTREGQGLLLNVSRGITLVNGIEDFASYLKQVKLNAKTWHDNMKHLREKYHGE